MGIRRKTSGKISQRQLIEDIKGDLLCEPPNATMRRAKALSAHLPAPGKLLGRGFRLVFDSALQPQVEGIRSAGSENVRRLLFDLLDGMAQLDLEISQVARGKVSVAGQVLPPQANCSVAIRGGGRRAKTKAESTGEFFLPHVTVRGSALFVDLDMSEDEAIQIGPIALAADPPSDGSDAGEP